jgi:hypothetical protein
VLPFVPLLAIATATDAVIPIPTTVVAATIPVPPTAIATISVPATATLPLPPQPPHILPPLMPPLYILQQPTFNILTVSTFFWCQLLDDPPPWKLLFLLFGV